MLHLVGSSVLLYLIDDARSNKYHAIRCITQSNAPEDGQNCCPKHDELIWIYQYAVIVASSWLSSLPSLLMMHGQTNIKNEEGYVFENSSLQDCCAVSTCKQLQTFRNTVVISSLGVSEPKKRSYVLSRSLLYDPATHICRNSCRRSAAKWGQ